MPFGADLIDAIDDWRCLQQIERSQRGHHDQIADSVRERQPNLIIIGAAKSATSSLATVMKRHPNIQISASMEPKFIGRHDRRG